MAANGTAANGNLHEGDTQASALNKIRTAGSVSIPPELFEKLYLTPQDASVKGGLRKTIGNPTPLGLGGFLLSLTPLSCDLMGWRDSGPHDGSSDIPMYLFFGGVLMNVAAVFELILGNTYIATVFGTFGAFWLSLGGTLQPFYSAYGNYSPDPNIPAEGIIEPSFQGAIGFFFVFMGLLCFIYTIGALRTNVVLVMILFPLPFSFAFITAYWWYWAEGELLYARTMKLTAGAFAFVTCMFGWYLFSALIFAALDMPFALPVFDLSTKIKGATDRV